MVMSLLYLLALFLYGLASVFSAQDYTEFRSTNRHCFKRLRKLVISYLIGLATSEDGLELVCGDDDEVLAANLVGAE